MSLLRRFARRFLYGPRKVLFSVAGDEITSDPPAILTPSARQSMIEGIRLYRERYPDGSTDGFLTYLRNPDGTYERRMR